MNKEPLLLIQVIKGNDSRGMNIVVVIDCQLGTRCLCLTESMSDIQQSKHLLDPSKHSFGAMYIYEFLNY